MVRTLVRVDAKMIKKVVPFPEHFIARRAVKDLASLTAWLSYELINVEFLCVRHMFFYPNLVEVEVSSLDDDNWSV